MVIGIKWFHFIESFLRNAPSFFRTTGAGKWLRALGDPSSLQIVIRFGAIAGPAAASSLTSEL